MVRSDIKGMQEGGGDVTGHGKDHTVTKLAFPKGSRTPDQIGCPAEGRADWTGPRLGFSYKDGAESYHMCVAAARSPPAPDRMLHPPFGPG